MRHAPASIVTAALIAACVSLPTAFSADSYRNGWSEEMSRAAVKGCTDSAVDSNMRYLIAHGHIARNATASELKEVREKVTALQSAVCACAQDQIMNDYHVRDLDKLKQNPDYRRKLMASCHAKVQNGSGRK